MLHLVQYISLTENEYYSFQHIWCFLCIIIMSGSISYSQLHYEQYSCILLPYYENGLTITATENTKLICIYDFHILEKLGCTPIKKAFQEIFFPLNKNIPKNPFIKKIEYVKASTNTSPKLFSENTLLLFDKIDTNQTCILNQVSASEPLINVSSKCLDKETPYLVISKPVWISFITDNDKFCYFFIISFHNLL